METIENRVGNIQNSHKGLIYSVLVFAGMAIVCSQVVPNYDKIKNGFENVAYSISNQLPSIEQILQRINPNLSQYNKK